LSSEPFSPNDEIRRFFEAQPDRIFTLAQMGEIMRANVRDWGPKGPPFDLFLASLLRETDLRMLKFAFPSRTETRFTWGDRPPFEVVQSLRRKGHFSHHSAMYLHGLTPEPPQIIYLNVEQQPKPWLATELTQEAIDIAFKARPRVSNNKARYGNVEICLLNSMGSGHLGVTKISGPEGEAIRVAGLERTLVDITVRPFYSGGACSVLRAYGLAANALSVGRLAELLTSMEYVYPYHQAVGFYLERCGRYTEREVDIFRRIPRQSDFYLAHGMTVTEFSNEWRLHYPKGL